MKFPENSLSLAKILNDKKRGQPITQKKSLRSKSEVRIVNLNVNQRRDLRGNVDERMKIISNAYDHHISQGWNTSFAKTLNKELQSAQDFILSQQGSLIAKCSKGLYSRLHSQMLLLFTSSLKQKKQEKKEKNEKLEKGY